jgi:hypothetical protein
MRLPIASAIRGPGNRRPVVVCPRPAMLMYFIRHKWVSAMPARRNCPSAQPSVDGSVIIGVVGARDGKANVSVLPEQMPLRSVVHLIPDNIRATEVLRFAAPCAERHCSHFSELASRIVARLPAVVHHLSRCTLRPSCRRWFQEGPAACYRCPEIVTEPFLPSELMQEIAAPVLQREISTMSEVELNPQPLPPKVDLGLLTEAVTSSVRNALEARAATSNTPQVFRNPRLVIGVIIEPQALTE